jgi:alpha-methylacyl-CoA racemase
VPVLSPTEASSLDISKSPLPVPHPHLTRTSTQPLAFSPHSFTAVKESLYLRPGQHTDDVLRELGVDDEERLRLITDGAVETTVDAKL